MLEDVRSEGAPGVIALVWNGRDTWRASIGSANLRPKRAISDGDRIRFASVTKTFVATVVLQLIDEGRLALDEPIERWLPGVLAAGRSASVRQLLNHTSGISDFPDEATFARFLQNTRLFVPARAAVAIATAEPLQFRPGEGWQYTNTGYEVLGLLIERVTGELLAPVLSSRIFEPLQLRDTSFEPRPGRPRAVALGYALPGSDFVAPGAAARDLTGSVNPGAYASGAIVSTVDDIANFYRSLFSGRLLPPELLAEMLRTVPTGGPNGQGLGIYRYPVPCGVAWGHGGVFPGYVSAVLSSRDGKHLVVLAANGASGPLSDALFDSAKSIYCRS